MPMRHSKIIFLSCALAASLSLFGCANLRFPGHNEVAPAPLSPSPVVYVDDFQLNASVFRTEAGLLPLAPLQPTALGNVIPRVLGWPEEPTFRIHDLVELMSAALIEDLANAGLDARRLTSRDKLPSRGWLVRGAFTEVNEGNRLGRALIGLGAGKTHLRMAVYLNHVASGVLEPPYELNTSVTSGGKLGALFSLDPYVAAADFVSCGLDLDNNVMQTASKISQEISGYLRKQQRTT
jgi:hypothetical protein